MLFVTQFGELAVAWSGYYYWPWHGLGTTTGHGMVWVLLLAVAWSGYYYWPWHGLGTTTGRGMV